MLVHSIRCLISGTEAKIRSWYKTVLRNATKNLFFLTTIRTAINIFYSPGPLPPALISLRKIKQRCLHPHQPELKAQNVYRGCLRATNKTTQTSSMKYNMTVKTLPARLAVDGLSSSSQKNKVRDISASRTAFVHGPAYAEQTYGIRSSVPWIICMESENCVQLKKQVLSMFYLWS